MPWRGSTASRSPTKPIDPPVRLAPYAIICQQRGCGRPAEYKVASRWSDGITEELKTYALTCAECLPALLRQSRERAAACRRAVGETLEPPAVYRLAPGRRDPELERLAEVEDTLRQPE